MVRYAKITVVLLEGTTVAFKDATLKEVVKQCLQHPLANENPLVIHVGAAPKLYFKTDLMIAWVEGEISLEELLEKTTIDRLVRNRELLQTKAFSVDSGSLWLVKKNLCILVDDDSFVSEKLDNRFKLAY